MKSTRLIISFSALALSASAVYAYDVFPGMIKPTAASPDGHYLVTKAPFAPHVVWQMPEGKPVFVASITSYSAGETPQTTSNYQLPPVITNDGWLITSSNGGQDLSGPMLVQASNIHTGAVQTLADDRDCEVFPIEGGVALACFSHLESWANQGTAWQRIAQVKLPEYVFGLSTAAANQQNIFGVEYPEYFGDEYDDPTLQDLEQNFGIRAFDAHTLESIFTVPFDCCYSPSFVVASGNSHFLWGEAEQSSGSPNDAYREPVSLHQLNGDNVANLGQITLAEYPHGFEDKNYYPQLSTDGRYLSGVFADNGQIQYIYDLNNQQFLTNTPYRRGLWLGEHQYASRIGEPKRSFDAPDTPQMVAVHSFPTPENSQPTYHTIFNDLDALVAQGKNLDGVAYTKIDYQPNNIQNGLVARSLPDLIALIEQDKFASVLSGRDNKVNKQFPIRDDAAWLQITSEDYEGRSETARYLAYRIGEGGAARWVIVMRLAP